MDKTDCYLVFTSSTTNGIRLYVMLILLFITLVLIIVTNLCMIIGMIKVHKKLSVSKKLFILLCISDFVTGITVVPIQALTAVLGSNAHCSLIAIQAFTNMCGPCMSLFLLLTISLIRYSSIKEKSRLKELLNKESLIKIIVAVEAICGIAFSLWYALHVSQTQDKYAHGALLIFCSMFCVCFIGSSILINLMLLNSLKMRHQVTKNSLTKEKTRHCQRKVTKTILIISITLILCYLPLIVSFAVASVFVLTDDWRIYYYHYLVPWSYIPLVLNSGLNSMIYIMRNTKLKNYIKKYLHLRVHNSSEIDCAETTSAVTKIKLDYLKPLAFISKKRHRKRSSKIIDSCNLANGKTLNLSDISYNNRQDTDNIAKRAMYLSR